ncbi:putative kelch-type beta propeller [Helianthus annuus]|nr:putative kelch-type beta propeller [Helianthus annuus]
MKKNHISDKSRILLLFAGVLVGGALSFNYLWASSSSSSTAFTSIHYNWVRHKNDLVTLPNFFNKTDEIASLKDAKDKIPERLLSGTFADLPAPETEWEEMAPAPVPRLDGASIQINELFYLFSGYRNLDHVHSHVDVYNFTTNKWEESFATPKHMANSHLGMATDGRYIYVVSGQQGPQCRTPPVAETFVLNTQTRKWQSFPPLPEPRYAPATQVWRGRLHVMGGGKANRYTPSTDHWSIAVKNGKPLEKTWRKEVPIPACVAVGDRLYVIGGQEGDFVPKPGSPIFKCSRRHDVVYSDVYMLDDKMKWHALPPMPTRFTYRNIVGSS